MPVTIAEQRNAPLLISDECLNDIFIPGTLNDVDCKLLFLPAVLCVNAVLLNSVYPGIHL